MAAHDHDYDYDYESWSDEQATTTVTVDGHDLEMAYYDSAENGDGGDSDGDPVLLLHGIPTNSFLWRQVAPPLADDRRVIVPDLVGYGNSASHDGFDRSIRAQKQAIGDLVEELGLDTVSFVSHDIGSGVALRYAAHEPDRVGKLVVSNGTCYDSWPVDFVTNLGLPSTAEMDREEFEETVSSAFSQGTYEEADREFVSGMTTPWLREGGRRALARAAVSTNTNHTTEIEYEDIDADLLCLWGADDSFQPIEYGERLADDLNGEIVRLDEAYHWVVEDRTEAYREELEAFLLND
ncbi:alpha/beta hydrolase [Halobacteriales archaeon QH_6_64_20]|nr:MAG: alpha/beta hydrolase [Halobacteriales archaeon QH_6_64_20]